jgi:prevent-host-death family protein
VTSSDYHMVMNAGSDRRVGVAALKAKLSAYLRVVRRGQRLVVLDRDTPVACVVPYESAEPLRVGRPLGRRRLQDVPLPPPLSLGIDVVALLMEERQGER